MAIAFSNGFYDASFNYLKTHANALVACLSEPTDYADTQGSKKAGQGAISSTDWTINDGQSGYMRRIDFLGKSGLATSAGEGTVSWWAFVDTSTGELIHKLPASPQFPVESGSTISAPAKTGLVQYPVPTLNLVG